MHHDIIHEYMARVQKVYATGETTEHSFRPALQYLFDHITDDVECINEPQMVTDVGRPDFVFKRTVGDSLITVGHCEAKDIDKDVAPRAMRDTNKAQHARYVKGLPNLIYTNGLDFHFYVEGELKHQVSIADFAVGITPKPQRYIELAERLTDFTRERVQTITSPERLAKLMAGKATLVKIALFRTLQQDEELRTELGGQYKAFKDQLIHDLTPEGFADIYAETVAYGMFAARLHDDTPEDFSREEALDLLPKSNPFLRKLFEFIARQDLDPRIKGDIDELAEIFQATNLQKLFEGFGSFTQRNDPFIHFYETFLAEYNPKKRKARGVWYTPEPVVNFIVRAVDDVLKTEFGLADGLADTSKIIHEVNTGQTRTTRSGKTVPILEKREMHRVQVLDPATGTGTFLAEVIRLVGDRVKGIAPGKWSGYVEEDLIPRLHGFELLMASYAMCHMKLDMMLSEMGYVPKKAPPRLNVFLTNSLEEPEEEVRDLLMARWLSDEAQGANAVKRDKPIMCIIGNPPYSGESSNKGDWIMSLMEAYKREPGGKEKLKEHNIKWLNDDYVKFIRLSESMIEINGEGILAFITNHGYLTNPTFRGMRDQLTRTFDKIYALDLHGSTKKEEVAPDGIIDENVFDILPGVAILICVKNKKQSNKVVQTSELWGRREKKYKYLFESKILDIKWSEAQARESNNDFVSRDYSVFDTYRNGFSVHKFFPYNIMGTLTKNDALSYHWTAIEAQNWIDDLRTLSDDSIKQKYNVKKDSRDWQLRYAVTDTRNNQVNIIKANYRPFDIRHLVWSNKTRGVIAYPKPDLAHSLGGENFALEFFRQLSTLPFQHTFITGTLPDQCHASGRSREGASVAPLYLYPDPDDLDQTRRVNMDPKIRTAIEDAAEHPDQGRPDEVAIFDYIYGVLHCPAYRETYAEFLKIDFPRVPYPSSPDSFWDISVKGTQLRRLHLMEADVIGETPFPYIGEGDDVVAKGYPKFDGGEVGTVQINAEQGFTDVPRLSWEFYIGGYQPAQKWLKDRRGRTLSLDDIRHYQRIIKILSETDRIMETIEMDLD